MKEKMRYDFADRVCASMVTSRCAPLLRPAWRDFGGSLTRSDGQKTFIAIIPTEKPSTYDTTSFMGNDSALAFYSS